MSTVTDAPGAAAPRRSDQALRALAPYDAKLRVAEVRPGLVARPALVDRLSSGGPVALISGPAGSGKTTLLAQWAEADERPFAWLTITEPDNDLAVLTAYLARAMDAVDPLAPDALAGLTVRGADGTTMLLPRLGRALFERTRADGSRARRRAPAHLAQVAERARRARLAPPVGIPARTRRAGRVLGPAGAAPGATRAGRDRASTARARRRRGRGARASRRRWISTTIRRPRSSNGRRAGLPVCISPRWRCGTIPSRPKRRADSRATTRSSRTTCATSCSRCSPSRWCSS